MPVGLCTARFSSSSSSNQTAMAASAALCHVCRFEKPSSNDPFGDLVGQLPALAQQAGRGEVVGHPDRLEVGREEQPARTQDVVAVGIVEVRRGVTGEDVAGAARGGGVPRQARERPECGGLLGEPQVAEAGPGAVVPLAGEHAAAPRAAVRGRAPGIELERGAVVGADAAVGRQQRLVAGSHEWPREQRRRALRQPESERREVGRFG
jgi:hypothetical protein